MDKDTQIGLVVSSLETPSQPETVVAPQPANVPQSVDVEAPAIEAVPPTNDGEKRKGATSGKVFSEWWQHYNRVTAENKPKAECKYCKKKLVGDPSQGTTHLKNHYFICTKVKRPGDIRQQLLQGTQNNEKFQLTPFNFSQENSRKELAKAIIKHEYPLSIVEHEGFRSYSMSLNPCFKMVCRNTIKKDCLAIYDIEKQSAMKLLMKNESRVAITTDMWTSSQKKGYMAVTAHYIDSNWRLQSRIIRFIYVPAPHTSEVLSETLKDCIMDWNLDHKLSAITVDNCSTNDAMMSHLVEKLPLGSLLDNGSMLHIRCCAHILNLIVKEGLKIIGDGIERIRDSVQFWLGTPKRWEKFEETIRQLEAARLIRNMNGKKLILDCETRWNSTYLMLSTALGYKEVFSRLKSREPKYKCLPTERDWNLTEQICNRLKKFNAATELFSGTKYPTANLCFEVVCEIKIALGQWCICGIPTIETMAMNMLEKFDKYWSEVHVLMGVAVVLDPRYKTEVMDCYFPEIYGDKSESQMEKLVSVCRKLIEDYEEKEKEQEKESDYGQVSSSRAVASEKEVTSKFAKYACTRKRKPSRSELDSYLEDGIISNTPDFDVLYWWKSNRSKYHILHKVARDILAIPASTVASESAFSTSGRVISSHRSRLNPDTVESLMCAQSWLRATSQASSKVDKAWNGTVLQDSDGESDNESEQVQVNGTHS